MSRFNDNLWADVKSSGQCEHAASFGPRTKDSQLCDLQADSIHMRTFPRAYACTHQNKGTIARMHGTKRHGHRHGHGHRNQTGPHGNSWHRTALHHTRSTAWHGMHA